MSIIKGEVLFASTASVDDKFGPPGNYYVTLLVDEETFADAEADGLKCKRGDYKGTPQLTVNLKLKGGGTRRDNTTYINKPITVVIKTPENSKAPYQEKAHDENGDVCMRQKELVRGSLVRVSYKAREWTMMGKSGVAFDLKAVQVLVEGSGSQDPTDEFDDDDDGDF